MSKKGFTLVEVLAVLVLLSLIIVIVYPRIAEKVTEEENKIDNAKLQLIYIAAKDYVLENKNNYTDIGVKYCINLDELNKTGKIVIDIDEFKNDYNYSGIQVIIGKDNNYSYKMVENCS